MTELRAHENTAGQRGKSIRRRLPAGPARCRAKFLRFYPKAFRDPDYVDLERAYKWQAHERWEEQLNRAEFRSLRKAGEFREIAARAVKIEFADQSDLLIRKNGLA